MLTLQIVILFILLALSGFLSMAEMAVVTSRKSRLKKLAEDGSMSARYALDLAQTPGRFLATIQIGNTLFNVLFGIVGGVSIAHVLAEPFRGIEWMAGWIDVASFVVVSVVITYFSVVFGELVPKRLALSNPERIACLVSPILTAISKMAAPIVGLFNASSSFVLRTFGIKSNPKSDITEEEVHGLLDEGLNTGVFSPTEKEMVERVFELDEQTAENLMTPRVRMIMLSLSDTNEVNWRKIAGSGHSHFPVYEDSSENVIGIVSVKSLWANLSLAGNADLRSVVVAPLYVPATMPSRAIIEEFRRSGQHHALVVDEFGGLEGIVTLIDMMEALVGDVPERDERRHEPKAIRRTDGTWLVDGLLEVDNFKEALGITEDLPGENEDDFTTLGGFLMARMEHIPAEGEILESLGYRFEILDMDRQRIDKVLVAKLSQDIK